MLPTTTRAQMLGLAVAIACSAGCGASAAEVREAKTSGYDAEFAFVYNKTLAVVKELYPQLIEDPRAGVIRTAWHALNIEQGTEDQSTTVTGARTGPGPGSGVNQGASSSAFGTTRRRQKRYFVRFKINIIGGRPWRVRIDGEASSWRLGEEIPMPLTGAERPPWLDGRIDALYVEIYEKLEDHAVELEHVEKPKPKKEKIEGAPDKTDYGDIPPAAAKVVAAVHRAAAARDAGALREHMASEFTWSAGGESPGADVAVAMWQADDSIFQEMADVLEAGCRADEAEKLVTCPPDYEQGSRYDGYRAGFAPVGGAWKMTFFYKGE